MGTGWSAFNRGSKPQVRQQTAPPNQWWLSSQGKAAAPNPARIGVSSQRVLNNSPSYQELAAGRAAGRDIPFNNAAMDTIYRGAGGTQTTQYAPTSVPPGLRGGSPGGGGRGGGGGGAAPAPQYSQEQLDWLTQLLARSKPGQVGTSTLDLPDYQGSFDPTVWNELEGKLGQAVGQSRAGADTAYNNLSNFLTSNYRNAFAQGAPQTAAPGMDNQAMARFMQAQGMNPNLANQQTEGWAQGQGALSSLWGLLGANEDTAQRNRLNRVQTDRGTTNMALDAAQLGGMTGIGLQRGQAQSAWQERADQARQQIAQQEAMANWERQNQVSDLNASNQNSYINAQMQALLGLMPDLKGTNLTMPNLDALLAGR